MDGSGLRRMIALAASGWFLAGSLFLVTEAIAASGYPGYSYARDYISDLGIPYPQRIGGELVLSSRAAAINLGFLAEALCFAAAALALARARPGPRALLFLLPGAAHAAGLVLIAIVHNGSRELADGSLRWHELGAAMAILGGNLAILAAAGALRRLGAPRTYFVASLLLGLGGLSSLALLLAGGVLPVGIAERGSVYAISFWEILSGIVLAASTRRLNGASGAGADG